MKPNFAFTGVCLLVVLNFPYAKRHVKAEPVTSRVTCEAPSNLQVELKQSEWASWVFDITFTWDGPPNGTYQYIYAATGGELKGTTKLNTFSVALSQENSPGQFSVRSMCDDGSFSDWVKIEHTIPGAPCPIPSDVKIDPTASGFILNFTYTVKSGYVFAYYVRDSVTHKEVATGGGLTPYFVDEGNLKANTSYTLFLEIFCDPNIGNAVHELVYYFKTDKEDQPVAGVQNFSVVNARTEEEMMDFDESATLDVGDADFPHWTIRANTHPAHVGSVVFKIDVDRKNVENEAPYLLAGHYLRALSPTPHILDVEAYSQRLGSGSLLQSRSALLSFINNTQVTSLSVLDAAGETLQDLHDGDVLNVSDPRLSTFNIKASLNRETGRGSVQFLVNGEAFWTENREPYIMVSGNRRWWKRLGMHTVTAIPYSEKNARGLAGVSRTITFTITEALTDKSPFAARATGDSLKKTQVSAGPVSVYPVPAQGVLYIRLEQGNPEQAATLVIRDFQGTVQFRKLITITTEPYALELAEIGLNRGLYHLQVGTQTFTKSIRVFKE